MTTANNSVAPSSVPDLSLVTADIDSHLIANNCYAPSCFRLVLEATSRNWRTDLHAKVAAYAAGDTYANHRVHAPGETVAVLEVTLDVGLIPEAGRPRSAS
ncbi:hypothetical protein [Streptomyces sp. 4F14]|uniref:hypothetical protein n=1 Tax=Streptomyces sp. 4F14 TaxID=3394380 RepID=UPI003A8ABCA9